MNMQIIEQGGRPEYAVVPWDEWLAILERLGEGDSRPEGRPTFCCRKKWGGDK